MPNGKLPGVVFNDYYRDLMDQSPDNLLEKLAIVGH